MRFRHLLAAAAMLGMLVPVLEAKAAGDTGVYVAPKITYNIQNFSNMSAKGYNGRDHGLNGGYDQSWGINLAVGYDAYEAYFLPGRIEVEGYYIGKADRSERTKNLYGGDFNYSVENTIKGLFVNGYFDLHNSTTLTPYVGAGLGTAWVTSKGGINNNGIPSNTETNFAWNVSAGLAAEISYNTSVDFGYRYSSYGTAKTGYNSSGHSIHSDIGIHQLMVGLRFSF